MQEQPALLSSVDERLEAPDMAEMRSQRLLRDHRLMQEMAPGVAASMAPPEMQPQLDRADAAAVSIQRVVRGFLARRRYVGLLFARFEEEERQRREKTTQQCREGELLVKNRQLWKEMDDGVTVRKNRRLRINSAAITIQRAWRERLAAMSTSTSASSSPRRENAEEEEEACSLVSDYSELTAHVRAHFAAAGGRVVRREDLRIGNTLPSGEETEEGRARRLRKHNLLSLAVEFAQLKQVDQEALPFDLHRLTTDPDTEEEETPVPMEEGSSDEPPPDDSEEEEEDEDDEEECELRPVTFSVLGQPERSSSEERQPVVDWASFEEDLHHAERAQQEEEEENLRRAYRLERARVLESLTMAGRDASLSSPRLDEEEADRRPSRFGPGSRITELTKPMQLCFINDISSDEDFASESAPGSLPRCPPAQKTAAQPQGPTDGLESLLRRQSQLQAEAKLALAQAQPMAKMQLEVEKDSLTTPIMKQMVAKAGGQGRQLTPNLLSSLAVTHLEAMVSDFQTQIEALNRRLMDLLLERDDLHMEQDSKLLDVEDLTRRAQEIAAKLQEKQQQQSPARSQKDRSRSAASRAQAKARSTTRAVTSRLAAFFKSSNQSTATAGASS